MNKQMYYTLILTIISSICYGQQKANKSFLNLDTSKIAIVEIDTINYGGSFWDINYFIKAQLTNEDVKVINKFLLQEVTKYNDLKDSTVITNFETMVDSVVLDTIHLDKYYSQYAPYYDSNGVKMVIVNMICKRELEFMSKYEFPWRKYLLKSADGGDCFFYLLINLTTKALLRFDVNGVVGGWPTKPRGKKASN